MFKFKQFSINQDRTAMKVGTDGVLLGAWADVLNAEKVLDIGTGTAVISLMIAQRSNVNNIIIKAIEIEKEATSQAIENTNCSPWNINIEVINIGIQQYNPTIKFDLIVSNPPFFNNSHKTPNSKRNLARHTDSLSFNSLLEKTSTLLSANGKASFIIPFYSETNFIDIASKLGLFPVRITRVKGTEESAIKRSLIELSFNKKKCLETSLTIEISRHVYTQDYINLTKDFYLKM